MILMILSNFIFVKAATAHSFTLLMLSRFVFGFAGSKVVHRRYIANHVSDRFWNYFYQKLVYVAFLGMITGPLVVMMMCFIASHF
jgi:hypothetical protein